MIDNENAPGQATRGVSDDKSAPTDRVRTESNGQGQQDHAATQIDTLLEVLGATDDELFAVCHEDKTTGKQFVSSVLPPGKVAGHVAGLSPTADVYFSVCPTAGPERNGEGRGGKDDITRMSAVFADLDLKPGGCPDIKTAWAIVVEVSKLIGTYPAAAVYSGRGLHPYWPIEDGAIGDDFTNTVAAALLDRFGRLVAAVAETFGVRVDNVFNLDRILRVPGTTNNKVLGQPAAVGLAPIKHPGGPIDHCALAERLDEAGIYAAPASAVAVGADVLSDPDGWGYAERTCHYSAPVIEGWRTDTPRSGRHPGYLMDRAVRLAAMLRLGCLDNNTADKAKQVIVTRFMELLKTEPQREPARFEISDAWRWGKEHVSKMTDDQVRAQLGGHQHYSQGGVTMEDPLAAPLDDDPIPLTHNMVDVPPFPVDALPDVITQKVTEVAEFTQTDPAMAATSALTVLATCVGGHAKIQVRPGWTSRCACSPTRSPLPPNASPRSRSRWSSRCTRPKRRCPWPARSST